MYYVYVIAPSYHMYMWFINEKGLSQGTFKYVGDRKRMISLYDASIVVLKPELISQWTVEDFRYMLGRRITWLSEDQF